MLNRDQIKHDMKVALDNYHHDMKLLEEAQKTLSDWIRKEKPSDMIEGVVARTETLSRHVMKNARIVTTLYSVLYRNSNEHVSTSSKNNQDPPSSSGSESTTSFESTQGTFDASGERKEEVIPAT